MSSKANSHRRKVLVLIKGLGIGGAESLIVAGAGHWDRSRFDYRVAYMLPWKDNLVPPLEEAGIAVTCLGTNRPFDPGLPIRLRHLTREWMPDIIHAHLPSAGILSRVFGDAPIVYTEHNVVSSYRPLTRFSNRATYRLNRAVIAVSRSVADSLAGYPGPKPRVIPNGIAMPTPPEPSTVREELRLGPDQKLIVHVGNIRSHKGHSNLIAATAILSQESPSILVASIGGEKRDGDLHRLEEQAAQMGVASHMRFLGRRTDAIRFLAAADVVVNPSDAEGLPLSVLEALGLGRPVVATDVGGVGSVVIDDKTGVLVPPGSPAALADGLSRALESPRSAEWGELGRQIVEREHGIGSMIEAYERTYDEVLGE